MVKTRIVKSISFPENLLNVINEKRRENNKNLSAWVVDQIAQNLNIKIEK